MPASAAMQHALCSRPSRAKVPRCMPLRLHVVAVEDAGFPAQPPPDRVGSAQCAVVVGFALTAVGQPIALTTREHTPAVKHSHASPATDSGALPPDAPPKDFLFERVGHVHDVFGGPLIRRDAGCNGSRCLLRFLCGCCCDLLDQGRVRGLLDGLSEIALPAIALRRHSIKPSPMRLKRGAQPSGPLTRRRCPL